MKRSGNVSYGETLIEDIRKNKVFSVVIASDTGETSKKKIIDKSIFYKVPYFVVSSNTQEALKLTQKIRLSGKSADFDYAGRKFAKQLEKAGKLANFAVILGEDEIANNYYTVKNLATGEQTKVEEI